MQIVSAMQTDIACYRCDGLGRYHKGPCFTCQGSGRLTRERLRYLIQAEIPDAMDRFQRTNGAKGIASRDGRHRLALAQAALDRLNATVVPIHGIA